MTLPKEAYGSLNVMRESRIWALPLTMILPTSFDTSRGRFKKIISVKILWSTIIQHTEITIFLVAFGGLYFSRD